MGHHFMNMFHLYFLHFILLQKKFFFFSSKDGFFFFYAIKWDTDLAFTQISELQRTSGSNTLL